MRVGENKFGYTLPPGAAGDPNAPWKDREGKRKVLIYEVRCPICGETDTVQGPSVHGFERKHVAECGLDTHGPENGVDILDKREETIDRN